MHGSLDSRVANFRGALISLVNFDFRVQDSVLLYQKRLPIGQLRVRWKFLEPNGALPFIPLAQDLGTTDTCNVEERHD